MKRQLVTITVFVFLVVVTCFITFFTCFMPSLGAHISSDMITKTPWAESNFCRQPFFKCTLYDYFVSVKTNQNHTKPPQANNQNNPPPPFRAERLISSTSDLNSSYPIMGSPKYILNTFPGQFYVCKIEPCSTYGTQGTKKD